MNQPLYALLVAAAMALSACGGGDGNDGSSEPSSAPNTNPGGSANTTPAPNTAASGSAVLPAEKTCNLGNFQQEILDRINQARASSRSCGGTVMPAAAPLAWNGLLFDAAAAHALDMATNNYFDHVSQDGRSFSQRISAAGYSWSAAGENIAAGQTSVERVMNAWLDSPGHCINIMSSNFSEVGVSCVRNDSAAYQLYWAMELAYPR